MKKLQRVWPKDFGSYLIMPFTFPIWALGRILNPKMMNKYFLDQKEMEEK